MGEVWVVTAALFLEQSIHAKTATSIQGVDECVTLTRWLIELSLILGLRRFLGAIPRGGLKLAVNERLISIVGRYIQLS